jgi:hypothetical protein
MHADTELHAHPHATGHRWIDLAIALCALVLSITSIVIAIQNDRAMQRLVTANSWPYLGLGFGNELDGKPIIHFDVKNAGIGPAMIEKFVVSYRGEAVHGARDLLARCCGPASAWDNVSFEMNDVSSRVLPARETIHFLVVPESPENLDLWRKLDDESSRVGASVCYSSVFGEHWITTRGQIAPRSVRSCEELAGSPYEAQLPAAK